MEFYNSATLLPFVTQEHGQIWLNGKTYTTRTKERNKQINQNTAIEKKQQISKTKPEKKSWEKFPNNKIYFIIKLITNHIEKNEKTDIKIEIENTLTIYGKATIDRK